MNKEEIAQYIKDNLKLEVNEREYDTSKDVEIELLFGDEVITSHSFEVPNYK